MATPTLTHNASAAVDFVDEKRTSDGDHSPIASSPEDGADGKLPLDAGSLAAEYRLVRRLDYRILPIATLLYFFASLDRGNIGNALTLPEGIDSVLPHGDPTGRLFDWINSVFFFSYILCQVPATLGSKLFPPRYYLGISAVGWGICSTLMAAGFNFGGLMAARFFLGIFEAGFAPGMLIYFSLFYTKHEIGQRLAWWFGFAAVAGAFGGLIAFGVAESHTAIAQWRLLFLIEGLPTVVLGVFAILWLPDRPEVYADTDALTGAEGPTSTHTRGSGFFTAEERALMLRRQSVGTSFDRGLTVNSAHVRAALTDWRVYVCGVIYFAVNACLATISAFLPTILTTLGFSKADANLMTVPPYVAAAVVLALTAWASDKVQIRGPFVVGWSLVCSLGYLILLNVPDNEHARYFAVFCVVCGTYAVIGVVIAWFAHNLGSESKRATGTPLYIAIGQCGSVLGSHLFLKDEAPRYIKPFGVLCALMFLSAFCAAGLSIWYKLENNRRDRTHGVVSRDAPVDTSILADKAPGFRYTP